ncbi:MAG: hypothetical protein GY696_10940 [Gammaproteobacteria bacterium]|nr:hypothetical protein [Gammaproteobacteria bacterium]
MYHFFEEVIELGEIAYGDMTRDQKENCLRQAFIEGLKSEEAKAHIERRTPRDPAEALRYAQEEESRENSQAKQKQWNSNKSFDNRRENVNQSYKNNDGPRNFESANRQNYRNPTVCYQCNGQGHFARDCPNGNRNVERGASGESRYQGSSNYQPAEKPLQTEWKNSTGMNNRNQNSGNGQGYQQN